MASNQKRLSCQHPPDGHDSAFKRMDGAKAKPSETVLNIEVSCNRKT